MGAPPLPAKDARAIFTDAEDYNAAHMALVSAVASNPRLVGPQISCAAFAIELYLKSILVDAGSKYVPATHDLRDIFFTIPKPRRAEIKRDWKAFFDYSVSEGDDPSSIPSDIESILTDSASSFDDWRYRFECDTSALRFETALVAVIHILHTHLTRRHPDWLDGGAYFESTFPFPKTGGSGGLAPRSAAGNPLPIPHYLVPNQETELCSQIFLPGLPRMLSTL